MPESLEDLVELLDLEMIDVDLFRGRAATDLRAAGVRRAGARPGFGGGQPYGWS